MTPWGRNGRWTTTESAELEKLQPVGTFLIFSAIDTLDGAVYIKVGNSGWRSFGNHSKRQYTSASVSIWIREENLGTWSFS